MFGFVSIARKLFLLIVTISLFFILSGIGDRAIADSLVNRINEYPQWNSKPSLKQAQGDLFYPNWMEGNWLATSTLMEQIAPLAPQITTPGFADNEKYLNKPISFAVRFGTEYYSPKQKLFPLFSKQSVMEVVADRVYNSEHISQAYLDSGNSIRVKIDPDNPNRQITLLGKDRKLISTITERKTEAIGKDRFITTEITTQLFKSPKSIYLNEVEILSDYHLISPGKISAKQISAIYLSPQDPDFFKAEGQPVAIYNYQLDLIK